VISDGKRTQLESEFSAGRSDDAKQHVPVIAAEADTPKVRGEDKWAFPGAAAAEFARSSDVWAQAL